MVDLRTMDIAFFNSDHDSESQTQGPSLSHFSQIQLVDIERQDSEAWEYTLSNQTQLPTPHIRLYDKDGNLCLFYLQTLQPWKN